MADGPGTAPGDSGVPGEARREGQPPYLHVRPPRRVLGVGGEGARPVARIYGNAAAIRRLIKDLERALAAEEGMAVESTHYRETDEAAFDLIVRRATSRKQMGEPRKPDRPDYSAFT